MPQAVSLIDGSFDALQHYILSSFILAWCLLLMAKKWLCMIPVLNDAMLLRIIGYLIIQAGLSELKSVGYVSCACVESFECLNAVGSHSIWNQ